jgi:ribose/xylose/arabinose/galactoside ABC-type transport system permease subunit
MPRPSRRPPRPRRGIRSGRPAPLATLVLLRGDVGSARSRYDRLLLGAGVPEPVHRQRFLLVVAVGMTFVILTGGIDLSVGSVVALTTMVSARW